MGAIYNIYSECETFWRKPSYCTKQQSIYPFLWQLSPLLQCTHPQSTQQRLEGAPQLAETCPVPQLTLLPRAFSLLHSLYGPGSAGFLLPCTWACFRFLFHEIVGQKNLPILIWQVWDHYHFRAGRKLRENIKFNPFLLETRKLRCSEVKGLGAISKVIYGKARTLIEAAIPLSQFKGFKHQMNGCRRF